MNFLKQRIDIIFPMLLAILISSCTPTTTDKPKQTNVPTVSVDEVKEIPFSLITKTPHDVNAFTEGLLFYKNQLFESTGATQELPLTKSLFGSVDMKTGVITTKAELDKTIYFGEGLTVVKDKFYQVTYKNQLGFIYDAKSFKKLGQFNYANKEGWGLTTDGEHVIMSDGTEVLTYFNTNGMTTLKTLVVTNTGYNEEYLNELEYINGFIYANVWMKNYIVKINPENGKVVGTLDLTSIEADAKLANPQAKEMNGIAYNQTTNKIYVTGKMWAHIYEIDFKR